MSVRLELVNLAELDLRTLRLHRDAVARTLRRGVPPERQVRLALHLTAVRLELDARVPVARALSVALDVTGLDVPGLERRFRSLAWQTSRGRVGVLAAPDRRELESRQAAVLRELGATPAQWGWLRRRTRAAVEIDTDLGAQDLTPAERRGAELGLLRAVTAGWGFVRAILLRTEHGAVRAAAIAAYAELARVADRAVVRLHAPGGDTRIRARWVALFLEYGRALPEELF